MSPPFVAHGSAPRPWGAGRRRGMPPFVLQLLRAPLTLNNIVALVITKSVQHHRKLLALEDPNPDTEHPCAKRTDHLFGLLGFIFILSTVHNVLTVARFHRIRRSVFGKSACAARRRWRRGEMSDEEREQCGQKMREMGKRMPSVWIASTDVVLSVTFLGMWILTTLLGMKEGKVELGVAYASIGALVASVLYLIVGVNGLKMWARNKKQQKREALESLEGAVPQETYADEKAQLTPN